MSSSDDIVDRARTISAMLGNGDQIMNIHGELLAQLAAEIERLRTALTDTADALEFEDGRLSYVSVQMDRDLWLEFWSGDPR